MKPQFAVALGLLAARSLFAADAAPADKAGEAIARLGTATNYSWTTRIEMPGMPFTPGPVKGQAESAGVARVSQEFNENTIQVAFKGDKVIVKVEDQWQSIDEAEGPAAMMGGWLSANGTAAEEAANLLKKVKELKAGEGGVFSGDFTAEGAKELLTFRPRRPRAGDPPPTAPKNAKGSVRFWIKDGALVKFESHLTGTIAFGPDQEEREFDMTRTTEIENVGKTKVDLPAEARKKLEAK